MDPWMVFSGQLADIVYSVPDAAREALPYLACFFSGVAAIEIVKGVFGNGEDVPAEYRKL